MIDPRVLIDKIEGMATKDLILFFETEGIRGYRDQAAHCPISRWLKRETGSGWVYTAQDVIQVEDSHYPITNCRQFIYLFDSGYLPQLEVRCD